MLNSHRVHGGRSQGSPQQLLKSRILGTLSDGARDERLMFVKKIIQEERLTELK
jgi:hypothetical protein